jgi:hypothetical protein
MSTAATATSTALPDSLWQRYQQAYKFAAAVIQAGGIVKVVSLCLGALIFLRALLELAENGVLFIGLSLGAFGFALSGWVLGLICQALGQIVFSLIDTAVNTSPILDNQRKAYLIGSVAERRDVEALFFSWLRRIFGRGRPRQAS